MPPSASAAKRAGSALALAEVETLAGLRDPASTAALAAIVAGWDDPALARARRAALRALIALRTQEAAVALARALATAGATPLGLQERSALLAVAYAEQAGTAAPMVVRALVGLIAHEEPAVAERAACLVTLFPSESHGPLARALRSSRRADVRRRVAEALGACRHSAAVAALVSALEDAAPDVRAAAARSLRKVRAPETAVALRETELAARA
jgi:HEAT repeats